MQISHFFCDTANIIYVEGDVADTSRLAAAARTHRAAAMFRFFSDKLTKKDEAIGTLIVLLCFFAIFAVLFYRTAADLISGLWSGDSPGISKSNPPPAVMSAQLTSRLDQLLGMANRDVSGVPNSPRLNAGKMKVERTEMGDVISIQWALNDRGTDFKTAADAKKDIANILNSITGNGEKFYKANLTATFSMRNSTGEMMETAVIKTTFRGDDIGNATADERSPEKILGLAISSDINPRFN